MSREWYKEFDDTRVAFLVNTFRESLYMYVHVSADMQRTCYEMGNSINAILFWW